MVDRKFYRHPKAVEARKRNPGSISLWLFANCFCRDHRRQGLISRDEALELGTQDEIDVLVAVGLWKIIDGGYEAHDWADWNPDMIRANRTSSAHYITANTLPDIPFQVRQRLADEVGKLMDEGFTTSVIVAGLRRWNTTVDARPGLLAYLVADEVKRENSGVKAALKEARATGRMSVLSEYGFHWEAPNPPSGAKTVGEVRQYMRDRKLEWLDQLEAKLGEQAAT